MAAREFRVIDPKLLLTPTSRLTGADTTKLQKQIAKYGSSTVGMPVILVYERADGQLVIWDGVTRASRVARLLPGATVSVEVIGRLPMKYPATPKIGDLLP